MNNENIDKIDKLQETLERIVNEGSGGLICIICYSLDLVL